MSFKKTILLLAALCGAQAAFAQTDVEKQAITQFQSNFNLKDNAAIFATFNEDMRKAVPLGMLEQVTNSLVAQMGKLQSTEFLKYQDKGAALYKATFERGTLNLMLALNAEQQVSGLLFTPYIESKAADDKTQNKIKGYPKAIAEQIFKAVKTFPEQTQFSIAVLDGDQTHFYGVNKNKGAIHAKQNQDAVFAIGSVSKVMTTTVLAHLVTEQKLKLSDNVQQYFDFPFKDATAITLQDLSNHTAGVVRMPSNFAPKDPANPYADYAVENLYDYLKQDLKVHKESAAPAYSNLGMALLAHTMERSQQKSLADLYQHYIFKPLNMNATYLDQKQAGKKLVPALDASGKVIPTWDFKAMLGAGGVLSTSTDLVKFARAQFNPADTALALSRTASTEKLGNSQMGLGWFVRQNEQGETIVSHGGNTQGHSAFMAVNPSAQKAVVILSNVSYEHPEAKNVDRLALSLLQ